MNLWQIIRTAILGPEETSSIEEAEAAYLEAKERYDGCVSRNDKRGQGEALRTLNVALNEMLRARAA